MPILEKAITIKAPVDRVFKFVSDPVNLPQIWPSLFEIKGVRTLPNGGHKFEWLYNMAGQKVEGTVETLEHVPNERIVDKAIGDVESVFTWKFHGENGTTKVEFLADYKTPMPFLDPKDERFVLKRNEFEAYALLENLKARFEV